MYCIDCGTKLPERAKFCPICGTRAYVPPRSSANPTMHTAATASPQAAAASSSPSLGDWNLRSTSPDTSASTGTTKPEEEPPLSFFSTGESQPEAIINPSGTISIRAGYTHPFTFPQTPAAKRREPASKQAQKSAVNEEKEKKRKKGHTAGKKKRPFTVFLILLAVFVLALGILVGVLWYLNQTGQVGLAQVYAANRFPAATISQLYNKPQQLGEFRGLQGSDGSAFEVRYSDAYPL